jgi:hypothetical protein
MPISRATSLWRSAADHFEPDDDVDPKAQRQLRGQLEQIDYAAYAANKKVLGGAIGKAEAQQFERLALATAVARTQWVAAAMGVTERGHSLTREQVEHLAHLRSAYDELSQAYDAMRRMVERGYLAYAGPQAAED